MVDPLTIEQEELLADMLDAFSEASGIPLAEIMASEFEESQQEPEFHDVPLEEQPPEQELEPEINQDFGTDIDDYFDDLFDDIDVGVDEDDSYADAEV